MLLNLPCPFCNCKTVDIIECNGYEIICDSCGCTISCCGSHDDAIETWNTRLGLPNEIKQLKSEIDDLNTKLDSMHYAMKEQG